MKIKFLNIKITGFFSIDHAEVDLNDSAFTLITGVNMYKPDNASRNGIGKSSIPEAIIFALTGETSRGTSAVVNKNTDTGTCVDLTFKIDDDTYQVIRYKNDKQFGTNLKFYKNGEDKSGKGIRDSEKILNEYLPDLTAQMLGSVIILGQGLPQRFTNNTPSGRKAILEKLAKSDFMIDDLKTKLSDRKNALNVEIRNVEDILLSSNSQLTIYQSELSRAYETQKNLVAIDYYDNQLNDLTGEKNRKEAEKLQYQNLFNAQQIKVDDALNQYQQWSTNVDKQYYEKQTQLNDSIKPVQLEVEKLKLTIESKKHEITKLESISDVCPTCGQKLQGVHKVDTSDLHAELNSLNETLTSQQQTLNDKITFNNNELKELSKLTETHREYLKQQGSELRKQLNEYQQNIDVINNKITELTININKLNTLKEANANNVKTISSQIDKLNESINQLQEKILYNNTTKINLDQHLEVVNKMITLATRDFRGFLLSQVIDYISIKAKNYALQVFENDLLDFKLDGNDIFIGYQDKPYEALSGGEKQKVDLIIQFSIRDMLSDLLDFSSNILVLDEVFDALDVTGCQKIIDLISSQLNDVESIFIITHHGEELGIPFDRKITIIKNEQGVSLIRNDS